MSKIRYLFAFLTFFLVPLLALSQIVEFKGQVIASADLEGIHVLNLSSKFYTITNDKGEFFINGKLNDTLVFSSVQYKIVSLKISRDNLINKYILVELADYVNVLNEVFIGDPLSGNLEDDIAKTKGKPDINFYDVGIPGYTGKPKTKRERELIEADHGKYFYYYGIGFAINVNKILNKISGRTKLLKNRVSLEKRDELMYRLKAKFSKDLFSTHHLSKEEQMDFFYFCSESKDFIEKVSNTNELVVFEYLKELLSIYKSNYQQED
jgi:hypothetical protein